MRILIAALAIVAFVAVAPTSLAAAKTLQVEAYDQYFTVGGQTAQNPTITADPGDSITVNLTQKGVQPHNFVVQGITGSKVPTDGTYLQTRNTSAVVTFTVPSEAGKTYTYICEVHPTTMKGEFKVTGSPAAPQKTPGFEAVALLAAAGVAVALFAYRGRK